MTCPSCGPRDELLERDEVDRRWVIARGRMRHRVGSSRSHAVAHHRGDDVGSGRSDASARSPGWSRYPGRKGRREAADGREVGPRESGSPLPYTHHCSHRSCSPRATWFVPAVQYELNKKGEPMRHVPRGRVDPHAMLVDSLTAPLNGLYGSRTTKGTSTTTTRAPLRRDRRRTVHHRDRRVPRITEARGIQRVSPGSSAASRAERWMIPLS
jgi:hypothetical protein